MVTIDSRKRLLKEIENFVKKKSITEAEFSRKFCEYVGTVPCRTVVTKLRASQSLSTARLDQLYEFMLNYERK